MLKPACAVPRATPALARTARRWACIGAILGSCTRCWPSHRHHGGRRPAARWLHNGTIIYLHKAGDRTNPANYRPITLHNTDYRAFTRMLARRLCAALNPVIDRQQSAFLPGRHIGDGILGMQLLPRALAAERSSAVAVFCDFRKAYDTVDRDSLLRLMAALGVPAAFRRVLERLLDQTRAAASVNGVLSAWHYFLAGLCQGCPSSPPLYLFVGQALIRFLFARGLGIAVAGMRMVGFQSADDLTALLTDSGRLPALMAAMQTFGAASGQHLNPAKTKAMRLGNPAHPQNGRASGNSEFSAEFLRYAVA